MKARKKMAKQLSLPGFTTTTKTKAHGGELAKGKRKAARPFDPKQSLHVVLRATKAQGELSLLHPKHCNQINALLRKLQKRWGISVYRYANVGNHIHMLLRARSRKDWQGFIRALTGGIAMFVTGAKKGKALHKGKKFWDHLVFTRIVNFGKDFQNVGRYVLTNLWEGSGVPVRKLLQRGFRVLEINNSGGILVSTRATSEILRALQKN